MARRAYTCLAVLSVVVVVLLLRWMTFLKCSYLIQISIKECQEVVHLSLFIIFDRVLTFVVSPGTRASIWTRLIDVVPNVNAFADEV